MLCYFSWICDFISYNECLFHNCYFKEALHLRINLFLTRHYSSPLLLHFLYVSLRLRLHFNCKSIYVFSHFYYISQWDFISCNCYFFHIIVALFLRCVIMYLTMSLYLTITLFLHLWIYFTMRLYLIIATLFLIFLTYCRDFIYHNCYCCHNLYFISHI